MHEVYVHVVMYVNIQQRIALTKGFCMEDKIPSYLVDDYPLNA